MTGNSNADEFERDLEILRFLQKCAIKNFYFNVIYQKSDIDILFDEQKFPLYDSLKNDLMQCGLSEIYSARDVSKWYNSLVDRANDFMDYLDIGDLEVQNFSTNMESDSDKIDTQHFLAGILVGCRASETPHFIVTRSRTASIRLEASLVSVFWKSTGCIDELTYAAGEIPNLGHLNSIESTIDYTEIWKKADSAELIHLAIGLSAMQHIEPKENEYKVDILETFSVGEDFLRSLSNHNALGNSNYASVVSSICGRVASRVVNCDPMPLRISSAKESNNVTRNNGCETAMRIHLTKSHEALRLMYWQRNDDFIQFSNIGVKAELRISDCDDVFRLEP